MNRSRITRLRDLIAGLPAERVNMANFAAPGVHDAAAMLDDGCGTPACICGWGAALLGMTDHLKVAPSAETHVARWLGLSEYQANDLFYPVGYDGGHYGQAEAVGVLDFLLETGEVRWPALPVEGHEGERE